MVIFECHSSCYENRNLFTSVVDPKQQRALTSVNKPAYKHEICLMTRVKIKSPTFTCRLLEWLQYNLIIGIIFNDLIKFIY